MNLPASSVERARWMSLLAKSPAALLHDVAAAFGDLPSFQWLRAPEIGLAMVRARAGGTGAQFNLGEMSVTRCALRLPGGETGLAYVAGRDLRHAELAAVFDALMQSPRRAEVESAVLQPIEQALAERAARARMAAEETRVDFKTMVRGDD
jgi:alpha-D-ribose 1-methylphosphonate 5-triphosphate synthase subunit PhnG